MSWKIQSLKRLVKRDASSTQVLARQEGTSVDAVLTRELEDVASAHAEELATAMPELAMALAWS
jgi:hypothetical protein